MKKSTPTKKTASKAKPKATKKANNASKLQEKVKGQPIDRNDEGSPPAAVQKAPSKPVAPMQATTLSPNPTESSSKLNSSAPSADILSDKDDSSNSDSDDDDVDSLVNNGATLLGDRLKRLKQLRQQMHRTETDNRKDLIKEQNNKRIPHSMQRALERKRKEALELLEKKEIEASGQDYERIHNLKYSIQDVEAWDEMQQKKRERESTGFKDYTQAAHKKYKRMISQFKPDLESYEQQKQAATVLEETAAFYGDTNALDVHDRPSSEAVDRMVADLKKQVEIRSTSSRRRTYDPDEDVNYINEKNRNFNQKITRAFDKYTQEIKESLERGTAL